MIVERLDQVFMTRFSPIRFASSIFLSKCSSAKGPFFIDLGIAQCSPHRFDPRRRMIQALDFLLRFRVLYPLVGLPQGVTG
jgi:hypothetical protein